ncbi:MAG: glucosamine 6-phosphate synthetase [Tenericutes bacterium]|nr:glucosamine 6-phosphate synthetase [Mycoplasmatota bacterium]
MCGIFGQFSEKSIDLRNVSILAMHARQRGRDSSGLVFLRDNKYIISRADYDIKKLFKKTPIKRTKLIMGHSRLVTNGMKDNQPVFRDGIILIHNGIVVNEDEVWENLNIKREFEIDSETIVGVAIEHIKENRDINLLSRKIINTCKGTISAALAIPEIGKVVLFSNNGSLYTGKISNNLYFSSESFPLKKIGCNEIKQIWEDGIVIDISKFSDIKLIDDKDRRKENLIPKLQKSEEEEMMLEYHEPSLKRCTKCILPETFPHIHFDDSGVCNYCRNYEKQKIKAKKTLLDLLEPYRRNGDTDCVVPFSGGRDSCYALHIIINELKMKPITYTYDWGMVTDLARRNISRMCSILGVENIIVAADISKKRRNIRKNLVAWLKKPHLGMVSILTAGDKHFFKYVETVKQQTGINLNLWGTNPLETTHFKAGFLGVKPSFEETSVYTTGIRKQMRYQRLRLKQMFRNLKYFNSSIFDTLSGEYYRSFAKRSDYYHIFDFYEWEENEVNRVLDKYGFEKAPDTNTTWRIGDGTAAFYNYIYYTIAGFTEHDTFRSNQIREGHITRKEAIELVKDENKPRYMNIRWYLDTLNMDYAKVIKRINTTPKLYEICNGKK